MMAWKDTKSFRFAPNSDDSVFSASLFPKMVMKYWVGPMMAVCTYTIARNVREPSEYELSFLYTRFMIYYLHIFLSRSMLTMRT